MSGRDLFGVVVRSVGLLSIAHGLNYASGLLVPEAGVPQGQYVIAAGYYMILGLIGYFGAGPIVRLSYRADDQPPRLPRF